MVPGRPVLPAVLPLSHGTSQRGAGLAGLCASVTLHVASGCPEVCGPPLPCLLMSVAMQPDEDKPGESIPRKTQGSRRKVSSRVCTLAWNKKKMRKCTSDFSLYLCLFFKIGFTPSTEPNVGLELTTLRSRPEPISRFRPSTD